MSKLSRLPNNAASEFNLKPFDATCEFAQESRPWIPQELRARAHEISGKTIFKKWYTKFETHHREILETRPAKLDPKRAQNFNKSRRKSRGSMKNKAWFVTSRLLFSSFEERDVEHGHVVSERAKQKAAQSAALLTVAPDP